MASTEELLSVEVVFALPLACDIVQVNTSPGATIQQVIEDSGVLTKHAEIDLSVNKVGIFGKQKELQDTVRSGDRIEIYRPLKVDPKTARRRRAEKQKNATT